MAEALSVKLSEAEKETHADKEISDAYGQCVKAGFAAVEVSRASNPFHYRYRVQAIHRREIGWDPQSRRNDWSDARYVVRKRWYDTDVAAAYFPQHKNIIKAAIGGYDEWETYLKVLDDSVGLNQLMQSLDIERGSSIDDMAWRDRSRGQVCIFEVWYRTYHRGPILRLPRGRIVEYNMANPQHLALVQAGVVTPFEAVYDRFRCAYYCGPHRLADFLTPRRHFPYVPFWAYREDLTGIPYGQIRSMVSTQEEINARLAKMMWLLSARRLLIDEDALAPEHNTLSDASVEVGRSDGMLVLNPNRRNGANSIRIDENLELAEAQRVALMDAIQSMSQVSGVYSPMMGQNSSTTAARAIERLLDAGTTNLAELNGNYSHSRREVGNRLLDLIKEDATGPEAVTIDTGTSKRSVYINRPSVDENTGAQVMENGVQNSAVKVTLSDVPSSPTFRDSQFTLLSEVVKSLPPDLQALLTPFLIEASNQPKRKEMAKLIREKLGIIDEKSPEAAEAKQKAEVQAAETAKQLAAQFDAELAEVNARTNKLNAEAEKIRAEAGGDTEHSAAVAKLRDDYGKRAMDLERKVLMQEADREIERRRIELDAEARAVEATEETDREKLRLASQERIAQMDRKADKIVEELRQSIADLASEVDGEFEAL
ncbi:MAG: hypothetical protein AB7G13_28810, partial [Lautropia sp.]